MVMIGHVLCAHPNPVSPAKRSQAPLQSVLIRVVRVYQYNWIEQITGIHATFFLEANEGAFLVWPAFSLLLLLLLLLLLFLDIAGLLKVIKEMNTTMQRRFSE